MFSQWTILMAVIAMITTASTSASTFNGFLVDRHNVNQQVTSSGINVITSPQDLSVEMMTKSANSASGYTILTPPVSGQTTYGDLFNLTESGNSMALAFLWSLSPSRTNIRVECSGQQNTATGLVDIESLSIQDMGEPANKVQVFRGYVADLYSLELVTATDGANMMERPEDHSIRCTECLRSGFALLRKKRRDHSGHIPKGYGAIYNFSAVTNHAIEKWAKSLPSSRSKNFYVESHAIVNNQGVMTFTNADGNTDVWEKMITDLGATDGNSETEEPSAFSPAAEVGDMEFVAVFTNYTMRTRFVNRDDVDLVTSTNSTSNTNDDLTVTFRFQGETREEIYDLEVAMMTLSSQRRLWEYGISSLVFPTEPPLTPSPLVEAVGEGVEEPNPAGDGGKLQFMLTLKYYHKYTMENGEYPPNLSGPNPPAVQEDIAVALGVSTERIVLRGSVGHQVLLTKNAFGAYVYIVKFLVESSGGSGDESAAETTTSTTNTTRTVSEVYAILLNNVTNKRVCNVISGCDGAIVAQPASDYTSFSDVETESIDAYFDEKMEFMAALIVSLVVMLVGLGILWKISQNAKTTLLSSVHKTQQRLVDGPDGLQVPSPMGKQGMSPTDRGDSPSPRLL